MSASTDIPVKWTVPWANGDASKVEIPVSSSDSTRASLTLGFPPLTMQPPESGGVPPQGEDFNGGMNQIARIAWWIMQGGGFPYDSTFATSSGIAGYPAGALIPRADLSGFWLNQSDSNTADPDATDGTAANWVPVSAYGTYAMTGQTGGSVTVYPVNAARDTITIAGTLTSNLSVLVPAWIKRWRVTNNTSGSYTVTVKTSSGSGIVIPQNGSPTEVVGDGTNITQPPQNIAAATAAKHPPQMAQVSGFGGIVQLRGSAALGATSATWTADELPVQTALGGTRYMLTSFSATLDLTTTGIGGMDTGSATASSFIAVYAAYNPSTDAYGVFATQEGSARAPLVYGGSNRPSGYTATRLISVLGISTTAGQLTAFAQVNESIGTAVNNTLSGTTNSTSYSLAALALTSVPYSASKARGYPSVTNSTAAASHLFVAQTTSGVGQLDCGANFNVSSAAGINMPPVDVPLSTAKTIYWGAYTSSSSNTLTYAFSVIGYSIW